jgi:hypothetical protein
MAIVYTFRTGSTRTMQAPVYDPDGSGDDAYGRQPLTALFAAVILDRLANAFPGYVITLGGGTVPSAGTVAQLTGCDLQAVDILYADTE